MDASNGNILFTRMQQIRVRYGTGFKVIPSNNVLEVGSNIAVNIKMTVGAEDQKVEVTSSSLALQTEDVSFKRSDGGY